MVITIENFISWLNSPKVIAWNTLFGIIGFFITIFVAFKTRSIGKELERIKVVKKYNRNRSTYRETFKGHLESITKDEICDRQLVKSILGDLEGYKHSFHSIFILEDRITIFCLEHHLKKEHDKIDFNQVSNHLANIVGRLTKEEGT